MISGRRFAGAIGLIVACAVFSFIGESRVTTQTSWDGIQVALVAGAAVSLLGALVLIAGEQR